MSNGPPHKKSKQNSSPNENNYRAVKHCSFATAKPASFGPRKQLHKFKPKAPRKILAQGVTGRVVWFNVNKGYGFIHSDDNDRDIFVHHTDITRNNPNKCLRSLRQGETVQFDVAMSKNNTPQATNVTGPNFRPVQGSKYVPDRWPSYNMRFIRHQNPQQTCYLANDYCKLRYKKQIEKQNNNKIKHNHQLIHQVKTTNVRKFPNRNSQNDSSNKLNASSTGYKPINNNKELVEPHREILNLHIKQDELIKKGL